jgi:hypothetical protein
MCKNKKHVQPLIHLACKVMCRLVWTLNETQVIQTGRHRHPRPHELKASNVAKERLRQMVLVNSEAKPLQIKLGTPSRPPARSIHPSFGNLDRLAYLMKTFKQITSISDLLEHVTPIVELLQIGIVVYLCACYLTSSLMIACQCLIKAISMACVRDLL